MKAVNEGEVRRHGEFVIAKRELSVCSRVYVCFRAGFHEEGEFMIAKPELWVCLSLSYSCGHVPLSLLLLAFGRSEQ